MLRTRSYKLELITGYSGQLLEMVIGRAVTPALLREDVTSPLLAADTDTMLGFVLGTIG